MTTVRSPGVRARSTAQVDFERREAWVDLLARLTDGFVRSIPHGGSPAAARLPGAPPDDPIPAIEGFARMSVAWGAWLHESSNPAMLGWAGREHDVGRLLARGLADATDPRSDTWWGPIHDRDQRIVEAAEIATAILLGGERLRAALDAIDTRAFDRVLDWLSGVDGKDLWPDNWVLFPVLPALIRRDAGRRIDLPALDEALDWMVGHAVGDGWTSDGAGHALDLYSGWAIHWLLCWWATIDGHRRPRLAADVRRRARAWLRFIAPLIADDGGFPRFGRSLGYRFAIAAPFVQAALLDIDPLPSGVARSLAGRIVGRALADGALDPATDWFRIGVAGARPEVVEGYVSAGASAWAAHALVALAMPAHHPFWRATVDRQAWDPPPTVAAASAGLLAARSDGVTVLHNARTGHPADIADHDYAATYGKFAYRSAFPFDVPVVFGSSAGSDDALVAIEDDEPTLLDAEPRLAHRNESRGGSAGPGWIATRYVLPTRRPTSVRTVVVLIGGVEVRVHLVRGGSRLRIRDGGAALGVDGDDPCAIETDETAGIATVGRRRSDRRDPCAAGTRARRCFGKRLRPDEPRLRPVRASVGRGAAGVRTVACRRVGDHRKRRPASHGGPTAPRRRTGPPRGRHGDDPDERGRLGGDRGRRRLGPACDADRDRRTDGPWSGTRRRRGSGRRLGIRRRTDRVDRWGAHARASRDRRGQPGRRRRRGDRRRGIRLDPAWAGDGLARIRVRDGSGPFGPPIQLEESGVLADRIVRGHARRLGSRLVTVRFERAR